jgi:hypothetical protein
MATVLVALKLGDHSTRLDWHWLVKPDHLLRTMRRFLSFERDLSGEDSVTPVTEAEGRG